nr:hypothetical protein [Azospirillum sp. 412522]
MALLSAAPDPDPDAPKSRMLLDGDVPSPMNPPSGCVFRAAPSPCRLARSRRQGSCGRQRQGIRWRVFGMMWGWGEGWRLDDAELGSGPIKSLSAREPL